MRYTLPRSAEDLVLKDGRSLMRSLSVYEILRRFSHIIRLTPFRYEDFSAALLADDQSALLAEVHINLLKTLIREDRQQQTWLGPPDIRDSVNLYLIVTDHSNWPSALRVYLSADMYSNGELLDKLALDENMLYPFKAGLDLRLTVLEHLCDQFLLSVLAREEIVNGTQTADKKHESTCRVCNKGNGDLIGCSNCTATYHLKCCDPPLGQYPNAEDGVPDFLCPLCKTDLLQGVTDCVSDEEKQGNFRRHEPMGFDQMGHCYWFIVRRVFVVDDKEEDVRYYTTKSQFKELLECLETNEPESVLYENLKSKQDEIERQISITEELQNSLLKAHKREDGSYAIQLGQDGTHRSYTNHHLSSTLATGKSQPDRDLIRSLSSKFYISPLNCFKWIGATDGTLNTLTMTLRTTILKIESSIPTTFIHPCWQTQRADWIKLVNSAHEAKQYGEALTKLECCIKPILFKTTWFETTGFLQLFRSTVAEREELKKLERQPRGFERSEKTSADFELSYRQGTMVKFSPKLKPVKHQVWKQKGEEYRLTGLNGWYWQSAVRRSRLRPRPKLFRTEPFRWLQAVQNHPFVVDMIETRIKSSETIDIAGELSIEDEQQRVLYLKRPALSEYKSGRICKLESLLAIAKLKQKEKREQEQEEREKKAEKRVKVDPSAKAEQQNGTGHEQQQPQQCVLVKLTNGTTNASKLAPPLVGSNSAPNDLIDRKPIAIVSPVAANATKTTTSNPNPSQTVPQIKLSADPTGVTANQVKMVVLAAPSMVTSNARIEGRLSAVKATAGAGFNLVAVDKSQQALLNRCRPKMAPYHNFRSCKSNVLSLLNLTELELRRVARSAGQRELKSFSYTAKQINYIWPYGTTPRPVLRTCWLYRNQLLGSFHDAASQLRVLHACLRWDELQARPPPSGHNTIITEDSTVTIELLKKREKLPYLTHSEYLIRKTTTPNELPEPKKRKSSGGSAAWRPSNGANNNNNDHYNQRALDNNSLKSALTPSRSGLRARRPAAEREELKGPKREELWVPEDQLELWEMKQFDEKIERQNALLRERAQREEAERRRRLEEEKRRLAEQERRKQRAQDEAAKRARLTSNANTYSNQRIGPKANYINIQASNGDKSAGPRQSALAATARNQTAPSAANPAPGGQQPAAAAAATTTTPVLRYFRTEGGQIIRLPASYLQLGTPLILRHVNPGNPNQTNTYIIRPQVAAGPGQAPASPIVLGAPRPPSLAQATIQSSAQAHNSNPTPTLASAPIPTSTLAQQTSATATATTTTTTTTTTAATAAAASAMPTTIIRPATLVVQPPPVGFTQIREAAASAEPPARPATPQAPVGAQAEQGPRDETSSCATIAPPASQQTAATADGRKLARPENGMEAEAAAGNDAPLIDASQGDSRGPNGSQSEQVASKPAPSPSPGALQAHDSQSGHETGPAAQQPPPPSAGPEPNEGDVNKDTGRGGVLQGQPALEQGDSGGQQHGQKPEEEEEKEQHQRQQPAEWQQQGTNATTATESVGTVANEMAHDQSVPKAAQSAPAQQQQQQLRPDVRVE